MNYELLAQDYGKLAREYADLSAQALKRDDDRKAEIDLLRAEIVLLHDAIADLKETIATLKNQLPEQADRSGSFAAQELLNQRELETLRADEKTRKAARAKFWGGVALIVAGIFAGGASTLVWHLVTAEAAHAVPTAH